MRRIAFAFLIGSLLLAGSAQLAEARGWHHRRHGRHRVHHFHHDRHGHGYFAGGFLAGAVTFLVVDALVTPRAVYAPPVVYQPVYYRTPVCQNIWIPGRWELSPREDNGFTTYYQVWMEGHWQRHCS